MKTTAFKKFLLPGSIILAVLFGFGYIGHSFKEALANEIANFDVDGLYAVLAMSAVCISIYALANRLLKQEIKTDKEKVKISRERPSHQRAVIKKTA